jgi:hypothetical protein
MLTNAALLEHLGLLHKIEMANIALGIIPRNGLSICTKMQC